jgi:hypothetical protein
MNIMHFKVKIISSICQLFCMGVKLGLTLREEHWLRMFENRVLRKNIWTKEGQSNRRMEEVTQ